MKWVIIKGVRYPSSVISAFAAYNMDLRTIDDLKARLPQNDNIAKVKNNNINTCKIMEKRMITKPFDLELAKKISNGECNGEIVTVGDNYKVKLVY